MEARGLRRPKKVRVRRNGDGFGQVVSAQGICRLIGSGCGGGEGIEKGKGFGLRCGEG